MKKKILVIDVGGSNVKLMIARAERRKFKSGHKLTPRAMVEQIKPLVADWKFDAISIGFPSPVRNGRIVSEPKHLGRGWVRFDFQKALAGNHASPHAWDADGVTAAAEMAVNYAVVPLRPAGP